MFYPLHPRSWREVGAICPDDHPIVIDQDQHALAILAHFGRLFRSLISIGVAPVFDRLKSVMIALVLAVGVLAGAATGPSFAAVAAPPCDMASSIQMSAHDKMPMPMPDCGQDLAHNSCVVHAGAMAILAPDMPALGVMPLLTAWQPMPPLSLAGELLPPDTPPPIAAL